MDPTYEDPERDRDAEERREMEERGWLDIFDEYRQKFRGGAGKDETQTDGMTGVSQTGAATVAGATTVGGETEAGAGNKTTTKAVTKAKTGAGGKATTGAGDETKAGATTVGATTADNCKGSATPDKKEAGSETEDDYENYSQCDLEDDADEWEDDEGPVRIKECQLKGEELARIRKIAEQIFSKDVGLLGQRIEFDPDDIIFILDAMQPLLESEQMLIDDLPNGITVVADIHGQLFDMYRVFEGDMKDGKLGWEHKKYLFLGDYVDRGRQQLEVVMGLFCMKILRPDDIFLLRGNHEFATTNLAYGFARELNDRYEEDAAEYLYFAINITFCYLSVAAIVGNDYFCVHGGISPSFFTRRNMKAINKPIYSSSEDPLVHDCVWSDPAEGLQGTCFNGDRTASIFFGFDALALALTTMEVKVLIRGHTRLNAGFQELWGCLYSIFTCTDSGQQMNHGAVADIDEQGYLTIRLLPYDPQRRKWENDWRAFENNTLSDGDPKTVCDMGTGTLVKMGG